MLKNQIFNNFHLIKDFIVEYHNAWKSIEIYPRASLIILNQAVYIVQIEQENLFNSLVKEWLERIEYIKHNYKI